MMKTAQAAGRQPAHSAEASSLLRPARTSFRADGKLSGMQSTHGNQRLQRMLNRGVLQAKLTINQPGDVFEQEADRVADHVMRVPDGQTSEIGRVSNSLHGNALQRLCSRCQEENNSDLDDRNIQAKEIPGNVAEASPTATTRIEQLRGHGSPLPHTEQAFFESRMGHDFSRVRVHTNSAAAASARDINALAYTTGHDIVFGAGQYQPSTVAGRMLMAHELTHVVQQGGSSAMNARASTTISVQRMDDSSKHLQRMGDPRQKPASMVCPIATTSSAEPLLTSVMFDNASAALTPRGIAELGAIASEWNAVPLRAARLRIDGFASTKGPQSVNWTLSCNRALAVITELETPTGGGPGIPAGFLDVFAQGATDEFSADEAANRRATIRGSLPVPVIPPAGCASPGAARDLDLQPVFLRTGPGDLSPTGITWPGRFAEASRIWGKLGVTLHGLGPVTIDSPLKTTGANDAEANAIAALRNGPGVEVFLVANDMAASGGASTARGCGAAGNIVLSDRGTSDTILAHELGHVMGLGHPGDANPGDANTIMEPSGSNSIPNPTRNTIGNSAHILCPAGTATTCLHPDP
jgi:outer membrane protein OmpA-like peptidoglycan-associated protein